MSRDQHHPALVQVRDDRVVPVRQQAGDHVLQALGSRTQLVRDDRVARIPSLPFQGLPIQRRWRCVIGTAPEHELLVAIALSRLPLAPALEGTIVALVEAPRPAYREPRAVRSART